MTQETNGTEEQPTTEEPTPAEQPAAPPVAATEEAATGAAEQPSAEQATEEKPAQQTTTEPAERRRRRYGRRKVCAFCLENVKVIDYKDPVKLRRYLSDRGRIEPRRKTGTCAKHQRWLSVALKRARHLALLPFTPEHIRLTGVFASRK